MSLQKQLKAVFDELLVEVGRNDDLRRRLTDILGETADKGQPPTRRSARRQPGRLDPMAVYREHPEDLSHRLEALSADELKDIIAENGMDRAKLAMKWKAKDRLVELIVNAVKSRAQKGDAFRADPGSQRSEGRGDLFSANEG